MQKDHRDGQDARDRECLKFPEGLEELGTQSKDQDLVEDCGGPIVPVIVIAVVYIDSQHVHDELDGNHVPQDIMDVVVASHD